MRDRTMTEPTEYESLLAEIRTRLIAAGYAKVTRAALRAGFLFGRDRAPILARDLGVPWCRDKRSGDVFFGLAAEPKDLSG